MKRKTLRRLHRVLCAYVIWLLKVKLAHLVSISLSDYESKLWEPVLIGFSIVSSVKLEMITTTSIPSVWATE